MATVRMTIKRHHPAMRLRWRLTILVGAALALLSLLSMMASPVAAQIVEIDPNSAVPGAGALPPPYQPASQPTAPASPAGDPNATLLPPPVTGAPATPPPYAPGQAPRQAASAGAPGNAKVQTFDKAHILGKAEGVFGSGAEGLAGLIEDLLRKQGEPDAYIAGREASGALVLGLRYGEGEMTLKSGEVRPVFWRGPSVGFDTGGNAARTFVLVYNLTDTDRIYKRFVAGEGSAYMVGGLSVSYLRRGNTVLIPIRMGVGLRLGASVGYMKFSRKRKWIPF